MPKTHKTARPYEWDWAGSCMPDTETGKARWGDQQTFSVGCFQWVPTSDGKHHKKSKVSYRIKGRVSEAKEVFAKADEYCARMNERKVGYPDV